jgi:hypothetical protein
VQYYTPGKYSTFFDRLQRGPFGGGIHAINFPRCQSFFVFGVEFRIQS